MLHTGVSADSVVDVRNRLVVVDSPFERVEDGYKLVAVRVLTFGVKIDVMDGTGSKAVVDVCGMLVDLVVKLVFVTVFTSVVREVVKVFSVILMELEVL